MISTCDGPECDWQSVVGGLCSAHYQQSRKGVELRPINRHRPKGARREECPVPGCGRHIASRGVCGRHMAICNRHKILPSEYVRLYVGGCANTKCSKTTGLEVDHDHDCCPGATSCGKCVRGMLCRECNRVAAFADMHRKDPARYDGLLEHVQGEPLDLEPFFMVYRTSPEA